MGKSTETPTSTKSDCVEQMLKDGWQRGAPNANGVYDVWVNDHQCLCIITNGVRHWPYIDGILAPSLTDIKWHRLTNYEQLKQKRMRDVKNHLSSRYIESWIRSGLSLENIEKFTKKSLFFQYIAHEMEKRIRIEALRLTKQKTDYDGRIQDNILAHEEPFLSDIWELLNELWPETKNLNTQATLWDT